MDDLLAQIAQRDPVIARLRQAYPGIRPVQFPTPWEAAAWTIIGRRLRISQAAGMKNRIASDYGYQVAFPDGQVIDSFPGPDAVLQMPLVPWIPATKHDMLQRLARASLDGELDAERLAGLPGPEAAEAVQRLYGIGPFLAELIVIRGVGHADVLPRNEKRLAQAMASLYPLQGQYPRRAGAHRRSVAPLRRVSRPRPGRPPTTGCAGRGRRPPPPGPRPASGWRPTRTGPRWPPAPRWPT